MNRHNQPARIAVCLILGLASIAISGSKAIAQTRTQTQGQTQTGGAATNSVGAGTGAQAIGSNEASSAVTGQMSRSADRMLQDVGVAGGTNSAGATGGFGGLGGARGLGGFGGLSPFGANPFGAASSQSAKPSVRTRLRAEVEMTPMSNLNAANRLQRQVISTPAARLVNGFTVSIVEGVATVSGTAATEKDRRMAELVMRLEPGIRQINNQIVVAP